MSKRRSIKAAVDGVRASGIEVARFEIKPDGSITIVPGKPEMTETDVNPWDEVLNHGPH